MRRTTQLIAAGALMVGVFAGSGCAQSVHASQAPQPTISYQHHDSTPAQPLDCVGSTGGKGCGPGWNWRDGWRGWGCYPC